MYLVYLSYSFVQKVTDLILVSVLYDLILTRLQFFT